MLVITAASCWRCVFSNAKSAAETANELQPDKGRDNDAADTTDRDEVRFNDKQPEAEGSHRKAPTGYMATTSDIRPKQTVMWIHKRSILMCVIACFNQLSWAGFQKPLFCWDEVLDSFFS